jgi:hypothetical protein
VDSREFEVVAFLPAESLRKDGPANVTVIEDDTPLGTQTVTESQPLRWRLPARAAAVHRIAVVTEPVRHGQGYERDLGVAVSAIGYVAP